MLKYEENRNFGFFPWAEYNINVENIPYSKFIRPAFWIEANSEILSFLWVCQVYYFLLYTCAVRLNGNSNHNI